jgi:hypothetical protein
MFGVAVVAIRKERLASRFIAISRSCFLPKQTSSSKPLPFFYVLSFLSLFIHSKHIKLFYLLCTKHRKIN